MLKKIILHGEEAREKLLRGVEVVGQCVGSTLGPCGRNAIIHRKYHPPLITNDGVTIARHMYLNDEIEDLGAQTLIEAAMKTNEQAGDGTTTSVVIATALIKKCFSLLKDSQYSTEHNDPMSLYRAINQSRQKVAALLKERAVPVGDNLLNVIRTSLENEEFSIQIEKMMQEIGCEGHISVEDNWATQYGITTETILGYRNYGTYATSYMCTNARKEAIAENAPILITNGLIEEIKSLDPLFGELKNQGNLKIVIIASSYSTKLVENLAQIAINYHQGKMMQVLAIKAPALTSEDRKDIAAFIKGDFIDYESGSKLKAVKLHNLGFAKKVTVNENEIIIMGGQGDTGQRLEELRDQIKLEKDTMFQAKLERRIAALASGVGIIRVGAMTESERDYLKMKIEDAVNAAKAAMQDGIVKGGGLALKEIAEELGKDDILYDALMSPYEKIQENAGRKLEIGEDIIDPVKVSLCAMENACSVAGALITNETAISERRKTLWDELDNKLTMMHDNTNDFRDEENQDLGAGRIVA